MKLFTVYGAEMIATCGSIMAKGRGGRPKKETADRETRHVRLFTDVADMLGWIARYEDRHGRAGVTVAQIADPLLRARVAARFKEIEGWVNAVTAAERGEPKEADKKPRKKPSAE